MGRYAQKCEKMTKSLQLFLSYMLCIQFLTIAHTITYFHYAAVYSTLPQVPIYFF
jgi:hypothetical protein